MTIFLITFLELMGTVSSVTLMNKTKTEGTFSGSGVFGTRDAVIEYVKQHNLKYLKVSWYNVSIVNGVAVITIQAA